MKNIAVITGILVVVLSVVAWVLVTQVTQDTLPTVASDYKNATYTIAGVPVTLVDGVAASPVGAGSSAVVDTRYFGNELLKDLNDDGRDDIVFLLTQQTGGSGTFFYVVAALNTESGYVGSHALLLGDRVAPQTTVSGPGKQVIVTYAERARGEPMTTPPSVGKSLRLILDSGSMQFGEVVADFEGEADPARMTLGMKTWIWQRTDYADGRTVVPNVLGSYTLAFAKDGQVAVGTDCNHAGGEYTAYNNSLTFANMRTTLMYCEGSEETVFMKILQETGSYRFTSRGELVLGLKNDGGTATFR
ncbi:MAG: META domain-containing protein [Candidatus Paceibacterota bacterium]